MAYLDASNDTTRAFCLNKNVFSEATSSVFGPRKSTASYWVGGNPLGTL